jgi:bacillithiol system protein YtxJ
LKAFAEQEETVSCREMVIQENRELSELIARETAVRHESPQVLLFRDGRVTWSASHGGITLEAMKAAVAKE